MKDDDEEEENTFGVVRYPCMPSLVALQQMRNRLHLAFLGRKLMKWTALATGRELRRLASELYELYDGFAEDMRNAFILLARSRYFYPQLNHIVTEDIAKKAAVIVQQSTKQVSSVKIVQFEILETEYPPYEHLGIEKGGQTIMETKKAWLELLKRIIMMMQLRSSFLMVEIANKNATKKMNVIKKIVIPRTNVTIRYIYSELEEIDREEFHRLKKVKEKKKKDRELKEKKLNTKTATDDISNNPSETHTIYDKIKSCASSVTNYSSTENLSCAAYRLDYLKRLLNKLNVYGKELLQIGINNVDISDLLNMCENTRLKIDEFFKLDEVCCSLININLEQKLIILKTHLNTVIYILEEFQPEVTISSSVEIFIHECQDIAEKLDNYRENLSCMQEYKDENELEELKNIINEVKKIAMECQNQNISSQYLDGFLNSCNAMSSKLEKRTKLKGVISCSKAKLFNKGQNSEDQNLECKLDHLKGHLQEVIDIIEDSKQELEELFDVESFMQVCQDVHEKLNIYNESEFEVYGDNDRFSMMGLITDVKNIFTDYKTSDILSASVDQLMESCDDMKNKIHKWTQFHISQRETLNPNKDIHFLDSSIQNKPRIESGSDIKQLKQQFEETMSLSKDNQKKALISESESIEDVIKAFEKIRNEIESESKQVPKSLLDIQSIIHEVMTQIKKLKDEGILESSFDDFFKNTNKTEDELHTAKLLIANWKIPLAGPSLEHKKSCSITSAISGNLSKGKNTIIEVQPPCNTSNSKTLSIEGFSKTCSNLGNKQSQRNEKRPLVMSEPSSVCNLCKLILKGNIKGEKKKTQLNEQSEISIEEAYRTSSKLESSNESEKVIRIVSDKVSTSFNIYEMQEYKKVKVTIKENSDVAVWEEKETITISKGNRDPSYNYALNNNDDICDGNLEEDSTKHVNNCTLSGYNNNYRYDLLRSTQSEFGVKNPQITESCLRECVSLDNVFDL